jgi:hypothetical protein
MIRLGQLLLVLMFTLSCENPENEAASGSATGGNNISEETEEPLVFLDETSSVTERFSVAGYSGEHSFENISTTNILIVTLRAMSYEDRFGSHFAFITAWGEADYECVQFSLEFEGQYFKTDILAVPGTDHSNCPDAPEAQTIDLSEYFDGTPEDVRLTVTKARYDFFCNVWELAYESFYRWFMLEQLVQESETLAKSGADAEVGHRASNCPLKAVYGTHRIKGLITIQTNDVPETAPAPGFR